MKNRWVHPSLYSVSMRIRLNKQNYCIAAYRFYVNNFFKVVFLLFDLFGKFLNTGEREHNN